MIGLLLLGFADLCLFYSFSCFKRVYHWNNQ